MSAIPRLVLFGGFLGSGKTTLMMQIAARLAAAGQRIAILTNDQGDRLVDTEYSRAHGFPTRQVPDGCFCCNFSNLVDVITESTRDSQPDYILAEAVGSCTDLVATVLNPLSLYHDGLVDLAGYLVLADGPRLVAGEHGSELQNPVTPREVLVSHQIKEAPAVVLSKIDLLASGECEQACTLIRDLNPTAPVLRCSAHTGEGVPQVLNAITSSDFAKIPDPVPIDYDVYAAAESEMGWYNGQATVRGSGLDPERLTFELATELKESLGAQLIHGKILTSTAGGGIKISIVGGRIQADLVSESGLSVNEARIVLNLRSVTDPQDLATRAGRAIDASARTCGLSVGGYVFHSITPGRPVPEHRLALDRSDGAAV